MKTKFTAEQLDLVKDLIESELAHYEMRLVEEDGSRRARADFSVIEGFAEALLERVKEF